MLKVLKVHIIHCLWKQNNKHSSTQTYIRVGELEIKKRKERKKEKERLILPLTFHKINCKLQSNYTNYV